MPSPRVVIIGAGFGGLALARALRKTPVEVLLIDKQNYHTFQPLLYQVATAGLEAEEIAHAVRGIFHRQRNMAFRMDTVAGFDLAGKRVLFADGDATSYDYLVLAAGTVTNYFGVEGAAEHGFGLKSLPEAIRLRSHLIASFERANEHPELIEDGALSMVVVGGGPTGVEMAGALHELACNVLARDFPALAADQVKIRLIEASNRLLGPFHAASQARALRALQKRGVEVLLERHVVGVSPTRVTLQDGIQLPAHTLVWAAGVQANPLGAELGVEMVRVGRVVVAPDLSLPTHPEVFVIGDMAASKDAHGVLHPQLAPVAMQGARHVARTIAGRLQGLPGNPFAYKDRGIMATIGRNDAVAELRGGIRAHGFIAWVMWLVLHLMQLVGFRNKLQVMINWAWNYVTYDRSARLILPFDDAKRFKT